MNDQAYLNGMMEENFLVYLKMILEMDLEFIFRKIL